MKDWQPAAQIDELALLLKLLPIPPIQQNTSAGSSGRVPKHLGSSIVLGVGCLGVIVGFSILTQALDKPRLAALTGDALIGGMVMCLGALAYKSAQKRQFGKTKSTLVRQALETVLLVPICLVMLVTVTKNDFRQMIEMDPVPIFVIGLWAIAVYLVSCLLPRIFRQRHN